MSDIKLNSPLTIDDIELRIGTTSSKGFSLLLYKTARTDVKRLDEVYGTKWKNRFFYDANNLLCCEISIYDTEIKEWVSRVDVGVESQTEKEKGSYSDAFKRAGFKWNIGTELYNSPFIWISWDMEVSHKTTKGKDVYKPKGFFNSNLKVDSFEVKSSKVVGLSISYIGKGNIFNMNANTNVHKPANTITQEQAMELRELSKLKGQNLSVVLQRFNISKLGELSIESFNQIISEWSKLWVKLWKKEA